MAGLIEDLQQLFSAGGLTSQLSVQAASVTNLGDTVRNLTAGTTQVQDLQELLAHPPLPPGLDGLTEVAAALPAVAGMFQDPSRAPQAILGLLAPVLGPLEGLDPAGATVGAFTRVAGLMETVRRIIELANGSLARGPSPFPGPAGEVLGRLFGLRGMPDGEPPDLSTVRARVEEASAALEAFGEQLDPAKLLELLRRLGPAWGELREKWPSIPLVSEMMEAVETLDRWERQDAATLTASLRETLLQVAALVERPRAVAVPVIAAAEVAAGAPAVLADAARRMAETVARVTTRMDRRLPPAGGDARELEELAAALERVAQAVDLGRSPLGRLERLTRELELARLRSIRTLFPALDAPAAAARLQGLLARLPAPGGDPLAEVVTAIEEIDLEALTSPLSALRAEAERVVQAVHDARAEVTAALTSLVSPVAEAMDSALAAAHLDDVRQALEGLPAAVQSFVDDQIKPAIEPLRSSVAAAVAAISEAADEFDPESLIDGLRGAIEGAAERLEAPEVRQAFQSIEEALQAALEVIQGLDFAPPADASIRELGSVEVKLGAIDPASIPEAAKPLLRQGVAVVTNIDFSAQVSAPLLDALTSALEQGPKLLLAQLQQPMDQLRELLTSFRPSRVVADLLDRPFEQLLAALRSFSPTALLGQLDSALRSLGGMVHLADPGVILAPLEQAHAAVAGGIDGLRPSVLLEPVNQAIASAVDRLYQATGLDDLFDGLHRVLAEVNGYVALVAGLGDSLDRFAGLLSAPGDASEILDGLADAALDKLETVDLSALGAAFAAVAAASAAADRDALAGDLARGLWAAAEGGLQAHQQGEAGRLRAAAHAAGQRLRGLPAGGGMGPRLLAGLAAVASAAERIDDALGAWPAAAAGIRQRGTSLQGELLTYRRLSVVDGQDLLAPLSRAPASPAELRQAVREALRDSLDLPVTALHGGFAAVAPHVAQLAAGLGRLVAAVHAKLDSLTGSEGLAGTAASLEEVVNLLRTIDLGPITAALDPLHARLAGAWSALDPAPLRLALQAAADALAGLLSVSTLLPDGAVADLQQAYDTAVEKIAGLSPSKLVAETLDPVYEQALGLVLPLLDLPAQLDQLVSSAGDELKIDLQAQIGRVEVAFDRMLRAIPLDGAGGGGASISGEVSLSL